jgi:hypothetical protein
VRAELCDWFAFSLPPGEQMLGYPVAGANEEMALVSADSILCGTAPRMPITGWPTCLRT